MTEAHLTSGGPVLTWWKADSRWGPLCHSTGQPEVGPVTLPVNPPDTFYRTDANGDASISFGLNANFAGQPQGFAGDDEVLSFDSLRGDVGLLGLQNAAALRPLPNQPQQLQSSLQGALFQRQLQQAKNYAGTNPV